MASERPFDSYEALTAGALSSLTSGAEAAMLPQMVLGVSLIALFIIGGAILMFVLAGVAIFKMRKDDFWDEPPG